MKQSNGDIFEKKDLAAMVVELQKYVFPSTGIFKIVEYVFSNFVIRRGKN
jgi:hypothetical protein